MPTYLRVVCPHCGNEAARFRLDESSEVTLAGDGQPEHMKGVPDEVLSKSVQECVLAWPFRSPELKKKLQTRTLTILGYRNITTIGELISNTEQEILRVKNCGPMILGELREMLRSMSLSFTPRPR